MSLVDVRDRFIELSGRADLANADGSDNGANKFINAGQRFLDLQINVPVHGCKRRYSRDIQIGGIGLILRHCRAIHLVRISDSDGVRVLEEKDYDELRALYPKAKADTDNGSPLYWAESPGKLSPDQEEFSDGDYDDEFTYDADDILFAETSPPELLCTAHDKRMIVWRPPADKLYTITIFGLFFSRKLRDDCDTSFWTENYEETLVHAALYVLEGGYRNSEGTKDWLNMITPILRGIDLDAVEDDAAGPHGDFIMQG